MINYELAKKLKDAGFPLKVSQNQTQYLKTAFVIDCVQYDFPTLSELIEACGDEFLALKRLNAFNTTWEAISPTKSYLEPTPEEAVAKLYLAINKK